MEKVFQLLTQNNIQVVESSLEEEEDDVQDGPGQITDGLDDGQSVDDIFANIEEM